MVHPEWQGKGLGIALEKRMAEHARARGVRGFVAEILPDNDNMIRLAKALPGNVTVEQLRDTVRITVLF